MREPRCVAVYGTLMRGFALAGTPPRLVQLASLLRDRGPCVIAGQLVDLGDYPGLVPGAGRVAGELYELLDPAALRELDAYEGSQYARRIVRLLEPDAEAWTYMYTGSLHGRRVIAGGSWAAHRSRRRDSA